MANHLVLYSTNTQLAYAINEIFYKGIHWVCCSPYFSTASVPEFIPKPAPSSCPCHIYQRFMEDIRGADRHSEKIKENKTGLMRGADAKLVEGVIDQAQYKTVSGMVDAATGRAFAPLLYVIPWSTVEKVVRTRATDSWANPSVPEYEITHLRRDCFDVANLCSMFPA